MENIDFDKYIRSFTQQELKVPKELDWENMNIPLPKDEKKKRPIIFFWWGLATVFFIGSAIVYLFFQQKVINPIQTNSTVINETLNDKTLSNKIQEKAQSKEVNNNNVTTISLSNIEQKETSNSILNYDSQHSPINQKTSQGEIAKIVGATDQIKLSSNKKNTKYQSPLLHSNERKLFDVKSIAIPLHYIVVPEFEIMELVGSPTIIHKDEKKTKNKNSVLLSFGLNTTNSTYSSSLQANVLEVAESSEWSNSAQIIFQRQLSNGFFTSFGLGYHKLHSTFSFSEDLGVTLDNLQKIQQTKHVFHNNYFQFFELKMGLGKTIYFGKKKKMGSQIALHLNPSFKLNSEGRTLDDNESIIDIEEYDSEQNWFWTTSGDLKLFYQYKSNKIFTSVGINQSISKLKVINNSELKNQQRMIIFNLGLMKDF